MGAGIGHAVHRVVVGQIVAGTAGVAGVKGKFQHLHAGEAAVPHQLTDRLAHIAKILCNDLPLAQCLLHGAEQLDAGALLPVALRRSLAAVGDGEILIEAAEVVDAHHIVQLEAVPQAGDPPLIAGRTVRLPAVERIAPQLTGGRKSVRGNTRHRRGQIFLIQLEQPRVCPCICRVQRHIDGDIADDPDAFAVGVGFQPAPLLVELELEILVVLHLKIQLPAVVVHGRLPAQTDVLGPLDPRLALKSVLHRHEQGKIIQPPLVFLTECRKRFVVADVAAGVRQPQQTAALGIQAAIVDVICLAAEVCLFALVGSQHPFLHQCIQTDEIWIARKGGKALIGAVAVAGNTQRQDLPVGLPGFLEPVHKVVCLLRKAADAVRGRQTADGQQNACTSLHLHLPSFITRSKYLHGRIPAAPASR